METQRSKIARLMLGLATIAIAAAALCLAPSARAQDPFSDDNWTGLGGSPGANNQVNASVVDAAGNLYIGGAFTGVGETKANYIAKWDGNSWSALGSGLTGGGIGNLLFPAEVRALAVSGSDLYAAGLFTTAGGRAANYIAKWNGSSWSALGSGMNSNVFALAVSGNVLYAAGHFTTAGGAAATNIAKWDGTSWSALGSGMNSNVYALAVSGGDLYAGGAFTTAGGVPANGIAKWNGSSWSALGTGISGGFLYNVVYALAVSGGDLYAGGDFTTAGGVPANGIAKWNGSSWSAFGSGVNSGLIFAATVYALAVSGSDLYTGGFFVTAGGVPASRIAKWNGSSWTALGSGHNNTVRALAVSGASLYAGGGFTRAGDLPANGIAKWNGSSWAVLGSAVLNNFVRAVAMSGNDLYWGGDFTTAGGVAANHVVKWNGSSWSALGSGMNSNVYALTVSGSNLYAGGMFTTAGGVVVNGIAKWNGTSWSGLGSGLNGRVLALAASGSDLYAGGYFTTAGGVAATNIAKWNGTSWSALGSAMDDGFGYSGVYALAVSGSDLYVGGHFRTVGGVAANFIAKWNGNSWSALGAGVDFYVSALAVSGSDLYAGGAFLHAGGLTAFGIAKWNGSSWSALGLGTMPPNLNWDISFNVSALAVSGSELYAGGGFSYAGGAPANNIAKWNGSSWVALGAGVDSTVFALAVTGTGSDLYAGGRFTLAGDKAAGYAARAILRLPSLSLRRATSSTMAVSWPSASRGFVLQQNTDGLGSGNWSNVTDSVLDDGTNHVMTQPMATSRFFRLVPH